MDPRYPVGKFVFDPDATPEGRRALIAQLRSLPRDVRDAIAALPADGLDTPYRQGGWTARQVVHHLADSHLNAYTRLKLALTEDAPIIKTYEEQLWAEFPDARDGDPEPSLAILDGLHVRFVSAFDSLGPEAFARTAQHPQWGVITVNHLLQMYAWHCRHHVAHIRQAGEVARQSTAQRA